MKYLLFLFLLIVTAVPVKAQSPKFEFRGVWVSTVANIDWPSKMGLTTQEMQTEILAILEKQKALHNNAIILQVRPASDAIYPSALEPWSKYLSGVQGIAPENDFDPLQFWIDESHKRGMELHAWFNPYRIQQNINDTLVASHIINQHPEWGWFYGNRRYFEPGNPEVWAFINQVVGDVVSRYDIDAIHFDDYFYPYQVNNQEFPDSIAFKQYGGKYYPDYMDEWRRHNVDTIIQLLSKTIKTVKPWVKFGISPFGVWRNRADDYRGSETEAGTTNYDNLFANIIKWQQMGWIDYTMPQLYWRDDHPVADFTTLAYWWSDFSYGRGMYLGLAPYRINKKSEYKQWRKPKYFFNQIETLRKIEGIDGFGFFSSQHFFRKDFKTITKKMARSINAKPAIVPPMPWIDKTAPQAPANLRIENGLLTWDAIAAQDEFDKSRFFVLYYFPEKQKKQIKSAEFILAITGETQIKLPEIHKKGWYRVSSLDHLNNESQLSEPLKSGSGY